MEDNLLEALEKAQFDEGYTAAGVIQDFRSGKRGAASFTYNGIPETIDYVPVNGTNWQLTYLIQEKVISGRIDSISDGIIRRSVLQSVLAILVLGALFAFIIAQIRSNAKLELERRLRMRRTGLNSRKWSSVSLCSSNCWISRLTRRSRGE